MKLTVVGSINFVLHSQRSQHNICPSSPIPSSATKATDGLSLTLEGVDDIHCCHRPAIGALSAHDGVVNEVLEEAHEHATSLLVDET